MREMRRDPLQARSGKKCRGMPEVRPPHAHWGAPSARTVSRPGGDGVVCRSGAGRSPKFKDKRKYRDRLTAAQRSTGEKDALIAMRGSILGVEVVTLAFEFDFHGGSMGYAVGEKFTRAATVALNEGLPLICFSASGGARMQEALISLMQMAKTSAVIERLKGEGTPYISVLTDPIYGGVSASLALLGDINIAEPDARAGFAGPNIIEQTIRQKLPKGFQRSEFLLEHGAIDMIVHRNDMRETLARVLAKLTNLSPPGQPAPVLEGEVIEADGGFA